MQVASQHFTTTRRKSRISSRLRSCSNSGLAWCVVTALNQTYSTSRSIHTDLPNLASRVEDVQYRHAAAQRSQLARPLVTQGTGYPQRGIMTPHGGAKRHLRRGSRTDRKPALVRQQPGTVALAISLAPSAVARPTRLADVALAWMCCTCTYQVASYI